MISIQNVLKRYPINAGERMVLDHVNLDIRRGEKIGILGRNGAGKSTLIRLISGTERPDRGEIIRGMSVSWPIAFAGTFQEQLTGLDNLRFICRIYNRSIEDKIAFVQDFSDLGPYLKEPVGKYSSGMRARLAFAISMVVEFDCYLIDEVMAVGDDRFRAKCEVELFQKRADRAMIIVSHSPTYIKKHCNKVSVLLQGKLHHFDEVEAGFDFYQRNNTEH
jgi:capsular polysaccharide transport system ATP-binding protein